MLKVIVKDRDNVPMNVVDKIIIGREYLKI